jgi:hypothetical protein
MTDISSMKNMPDLSTLFSGWVDLELLGVGGLK